MERIDAFRMLGRMDYAVEFLLQKYGLSMAKEAPDWPTLFMSLSLNVDGYDRVFCESMAKASARFVEETKNTTLNQFQADHQRTIGGEEAKFIFTHYPDNYAEKLLELRDFSDEMQQASNKKKKEIVKNVILGLCVIGLLVVAMSVYKMPYFSEERDYSHLQEVYDTGSIDMLTAGIVDYTEKYPDGKHRSEVLFMPVKYLKDSPDVLEVMGAIDFYLQEDPRGPYVEECKAIGDKIWDKEIDRYKGFVSSSTSKEATDFVIAMLEYMKKHQVRQVDVIGVPNLAIKDYNEYPREIRQWLESLPTEMIAGSKLNNLKLPDGLVSIKDKLTKNTAEKWSEYIVQALQYGFNQVLTPGFIDFVDVPESVGQQDRNYPKVTVNYTVSTQESVKGIPDIWTYTEGYAGATYSAKYYLGISMTFDAKFSLPGEVENYNISRVGDAGTDEVKNIDTSDIYSKMCELSTQAFATKIAQEFGLTSK